MISGSIRYIGRDHASTIRDAQGNIMATYRYTNTGPASLKLNERPIYGSSRLGSLRAEMDLHSLPAFNPQNANPVQQVDLNYELTDHLGNVCAVVTGRLLDGNGGGTPKQAELVSAQGYEPFGALLPGRNYSSNSYRFGLNGQEKDDEIYGATGTSYTAQFWQYDPRTGRRWNLDPKPQVSISDYAAFGLNPILFTDPLGDRIRARGEARDALRAYERRLNRMENDLRGNTSAGATQLAGYVSQQRTALRTMRQSDVLYTIGMGNDVHIAVNENRRVNRGRVDISIRGDADALPDLAATSTTALLFETGQFSFSNNANRGDHLSLGSGLLSDLTDYQLIKENSMAIAVDHTSTTLDLDMQNFNATSQNYVQAIQGTLPLFQQTQLGLSTPKTPNLQNGAIDGSVAGQQPCTRYDCEAARANDWRMDNGFQGPSRSEMKEMKR